MRATLLVVASSPALALMRSLSDAHVPSCLIVGIAIMPRHSVVDLLPTGTQRIKPSQKSCSGLEIPRELRLLEDGQN